MGDPTRRDVMRGGLAAALGLGLPGASIVPGSRPGDFRELERVRRVPWPVPIWALGAIEALIGSANILPFEGFPAGMLRLMGADLKAEVVREPDVKSRGYVRWRPISLLVTYDLRLNATDGVRGIAIPRRDFAALPWGEPA